MLDTLFACIYFTLNRKNFLWLHIFSNCCLFSFLLEQNFFEVALKFPTFACSVIHSNQAFILTTIPKVFLFTMPVSLCCWICLSTVILPILNNVLQVNTPFPVNHLFGLTFRHLTFLSQYSLSSFPGKNYGVPGLSSYLHFSFPSNKIKLDV
jgi:hypothetical protein